MTNGSLPYHGHRSVAALFLCLIYDLFTICTIVVFRYVSELNMCAIIIISTYFSHLYCYLCCVVVAWLAYLGFSTLSALCSMMFRSIRVMSEVSPFYYSEKKLTSVFSWLCRKFFLAWNKIIWSTNYLYVTVVIVTILIQNMTFKGPATRK